jgi:hypothetical protein
LIGCNRYVADTGNHRIRKVTPSGFVSTVAGCGVPGSRDGSHAIASFNAPEGLCVDPVGNMYFIIFLPSLHIISPHTIILLWRS